MGASAFPEPLLIRSAKSCPLAISTWASKRLKTSKSPYGPTKSWFDPESAGKGDWRKAPAENVALDGDLSIHCSDCRRWGIGPLGILYVGPM